MKKGWNFFAGLLAGFLLALGLTAGAFYVNLGSHTILSRWAFDITRKKRLLVEQTSPPRLLLVGGSATLFGLSAREIERQTGWRTINLATHAALGPTYLLREARRSAKPGDTVLLTLEYELYTFGKISPRRTDAILLDYIVARDPAFFRELTLREQWNVFMLTSNDRLLQGIKNRFRPEPPQWNMEIYNLQCLNEWGDQTGHTEAARAKSTDTRGNGLSVLASGLPPRPDGFPIIAAFCAWARTNNIRVLATYPNLLEQPQYHTPAARESIRKITSFFAHLDVPVVGEYTEPILPAEKFFDTVYHLTEDAALARTRLLAGELKPYLLPRYQAAAGTP